MPDKLRLGTVTIGDLLLNGEITEMDVGGELKEIQLSIPPYQRPYKWTAKNANQLFDDINAARVAGKAVYRVGTLILHHNIKNGEERYDIVDGQQRTITFALLLKLVGEQDIGFLNQKLADNGVNLRNVTGNYRALERRVGKFTDKKELESFTVYIKEHCELIVVITEDLSEAFQFFDSQNSRGKPLYPHDLLKAYHLREMDALNTAETEKVVKTWEEMDQKKLSVLFGEYLYRLREWIKGNRPDKLNEQNIDLFKGITAHGNFPYAQYYKGAYAYASEFNNSNYSFVTGTGKLSRFQLNAPIIAGKPFFEYAKHYYGILADIQDNDNYGGCFINGNEIVKTLDLYDNKQGTGNRITRLMFDTALLLYVDRFCQEVPSKVDTEGLEQFVVYAFIWAYSMRAQYRNVGWLVAMNYIIGVPAKENIVNAFNIYKDIAYADSPAALMSTLDGKLVPLVVIKAKVDNPDVYNNDKDKVYKSYLHYFKENNFWEGNNEQRKISAQ